MWVSRHSPKLPIVAKRRARSSQEEDALHEYPHFPATRMRSTIRVPDTVWTDPSGRRAVAEDLSDFQPCNELFDM